jgi:plastocyanin
VPVTVTVGASVSAPAHLAPGLACLQIGGAPGETVQLARPRSGATRATLAADVATFTSTGLPSALEHDFVLAGGADVGSTMCVLLSPGTYFALDTTPQTVTPEQIATVSVGGAPHGSTPPHITGAITAIGAMSWAPGPTRIPAQGTLAFLNASTETHFVSMVRYQAGKTLADLRAVLADPAADPGTVLDMTAHLDSGVVSAGRGQTLSYSLPAGSYAVLCFWPDLATGMPHAAMGMVRSITVG